MLRAMVVGCPGSGKSTFARALAERTGLPLWHLDRMNWNPDRTAVPEEVFLHRLRAALAGERWIIDGNYGGTMRLRLQACDAVFFLDYPTEVCLEGVRRRQGRPRSDMPWAEARGEEDPAFLEFIRRYPLDSRPRVLSLLEEFPDREIHVFRSRAEAEAFLRGLEADGKKEE